MQKYVIIIHRRVVRLFFLQSQLGVNDEQIAHRSPHCGADDRCGPGGNKWISPTRVGVRWCLSSKELFREEGSSDDLSDGDEKAHYEMGIQWPCVDRCFLRFIVENGPDQEQGGRAPNEVFRLAP